MSIRNSSFRNEKDIPEVKLQEMEATSQKDVKFLDHAKDAIYQQRGNWSWKSVSRVSFSKMVALPGFLSIPLTHCLYLYTRLLYINRP